MEQLYQEVILDYYRNPRNKGHLDNPQIKACDVNDSCGDEITIEATEKNGKMSEIKFSGQGCAISQSAASMLTEYVQGKSVENIAKLNKEEVLKLLNIPVSGMRLKCALLGFKVLKLGIIEYLGGKNGSSS
ncbi:SUF system NifU family Fe-S cluster assembly protein [Candidatus Woesearchaeota archaeon CG10_big_fil_rev_8_21_14_0_10_37_12]|nr:MAG: SUF system NifU family Fe-S cluster assembly protein [Candidatus Woesearchaeota archaeon CG10_big_fil_rev_8_21_14_0_10_37_12]